MVAFRLAIGLKENLRDKVGTLMEVVARIRASSSRINLMGLGFSYTKMEVDTKDSGRTI